MICPICIKEFLEKELTEEHIIPASVGGVIKTKTCATCNNTLGSKIDSHLLSWMHNEEANEGLRSMRVDMVVNNHKVNNHVIWPKDPNETIKINAIKKTTDPKALEGLKNSLLAGDDKIEMKFNLRFNPNKMYLSVLKIAYLFIYKKIGESYATSKELYKIRSMIEKANHADEDLKYLILSLSRNKPIFPDKKLQVGVIAYNQHNLPHYLVLIKLKTEVERYFGVVLPMLATNYKHFIEMQKKEFEKQKLLKSKIP